MSESLSVRGEKLTADLQQLVVDCLKAHPEGLTRAQVIRFAGLDGIKISGQIGYIAWTALQQLVKAGRVQKEKATYFLV